MAIKYLDGGRITGLSTDAKPDRDTSDSTSPALTVQAGSVFIETDTGSKYVHNGTAWIQQPFDSITSAGGKDSGIPKRQWFQEWFTGKSLNTDIWGTGYTNGTGAFAMIDSVDGGFKITSGGSHANNNSWISFHANVTSITAPNKQFSPYSSVIIDVMKYPLAKSVYATAGGGFSSTGRGDQATSSGESNAVHLVNVSAGANFRFITTNAGNTQISYGADTSVAFDNNYHCNKIELKSSSAENTLDGVLVATLTGQLPAHDQAPCYGSQGYSNSNPAIQLLYVEAYNT